MDNQARLFKGLGIPWAEMQQELPETLVITNYTKDPAYLEVVFDLEQCLVLPMGRNLMCICDPYIRKILEKREGELTVGGTIGFELIRPFWDQEPNFSMIELTGNQPGSRHILAVDKNSLPTLKETVIATLNEETLDNLRKSEYEFLVKDHKTHILNFRFHVLDHECEFYWQNRLEMTDICPSCSCERSIGLRRWAWDEL